MSPNRMLLLMGVLFTAVPLAVEWVGATGDRRQAPGLAWLLEWPFPYAYALLMAAAFALHGAWTQRGSAGRRVVAAFKGAFVGAMGFVLVLLVVTQQHLLLGGRP